MHIKLTYGTGKGKTNTVTLNQMPPKKQTNKQRNRQTNKETYKYPPQKGKQCNITFISECFELTFHTQCSLVQGSHDFPFTLPAHGLCSGRGLTPNGTIKMRIGSWNLVTALIWATQSSDRMFTGVENSSTLSKCQTGIPLNNTDVPDKTASHFGHSASNKWTTGFTGDEGTPDQHSPSSHFSLASPPHCKDRAIKFSTPFYSSLYATSFLPSLLFKLLFLPSSLPPLPTTPVTHQLSVCLPSARLSNKPGTSPWPIRRLRRLPGCSTCFMLPLYPLPQAHQSRVSIFSLLHSRD